MTEQSPTPVPITLGQKPKEVRGPRGTYRPKKPKTPLQRRAEATSYITLKSAREYLDFLEKIWRDPAQELEARLKAGKEWAAYAMGPSSAPPRKGEGGSQRTQFNIVGIGQPAQVKPEPEKPKDVIDALPAPKPIMSYPQPNGRLVILNGKDSK